MLFCKKNQVAKCSKKSLKKAQRHKKLLCMKNSHSTKPHLMLAYQMQQNGVVANHMLSLKKSRLPCFCSNICMIIRILLMLSFG